MSIKIDNMVQNKKIKVDELTKLSGHELSK